MIIQTTVTIVTSINEYCLQQPRTLYLASGILSVACAQPFALPNTLLKIKTQSLSSLAAISASCVSLLYTASRIWLAS